MRRILILVISFIGLFSCHSPKKIKVFLAGDSTMQTNDTNKTLIRGWGQLFPEAFDTSRVEIINHAIGGRSTNHLKRVVVGKDYLVRCSKMIKLLFSLA